MSTMAPETVQQLLLSAGLSSQDAQTLTAIAGAESGYDPNAIGDVNLENATWGPSVGLWQIRTEKAETNTGGTRDINALEASVQVQAADAAQIWHTQGPSAWSTYQNGAYKRYLGTIPPVATGGGANAQTVGLNWGDLYQPWNIPGDLAGSAGSAAAGALGGVFGPLLTGFEKFAATGLFALLGLGLIAGGLMMAGKVPEKLQSAAQTAGPAVAAAAA